MALPPSIVSLIHQMVWRSNLEDCLFEMLLRSTVFNDEDTPFMAPSAIYLADTWQERERVFDILEPHLLGSTRLTKAVDFNNACFTGFIAPDAPN